jgi:hypothetical protein
MPDEFEQYLMSFQPRAPELLPRVPRKRAWRWVWIPAIAAAACLLVVFLMPRSVEGPIPFTVAASTALLASETSWDSVLDTSAFRPENPVPNSMIELLGQEKISR